MTDRFSLAWEVDGLTRRKGKRMGTLWCLSDDIDGEVTFSVEGFDSLSELAKLDLLKDYIGLLTREYEFRLKNWNLDDGTKN